MDQKTADQENANREDPPATEQEDAGATPDAGAAPNTATPPGSRCWKCLPEPWSQENPPKSVPNVKPAKRSA